MIDTTTDTAGTGPAPPVLAARGLFGGVLMGLANLVPGISGGTMLLAAGVYPQFINGVAEVTTLRLRFRSVLLLVAVVAGAAVAIVGLAGVVKDLVVEHRWVMYSLFIGLTLGGVPLIWRMLRPIRPSAIAGAVVGTAAMAVLAWVQLGTPTGGGSSEVNFALLFVAGLVGGAAMILPGVSGGYLLLVLGQYLVILGAIHSAREAVGAREWGDVAQAMKVFVPVGLGVVVGVVGVSNLLKLLLARCRQATLGVLLGLLLGAVLGLWPFQRPVGELPIGATVKGVVVTADNRDEFEIEDYPAELFRPGAGQVGGAAGLILLGFAGSLLVARVGGRDE